MEVAVTTLDQGDAARRALEIMARVGRAKGADPSLSQRDEGSARLAMESGRAVFQVNYPFVLPGIAENGGGAFLDDNGNPTNSDTGRRVQDEFAWAPFPGMEEGKPATVTIGIIASVISCRSRYTSPPCRQPASVNGPGTGILAGACVIERSRRYSSTNPRPCGARTGSMHR